MIYEFARQAISLGIVQKAPQPNAVWEFPRFASGEEGAAMAVGADTIWQTRWVPWRSVAQDWRRHLGSGA